MIRKAKKCRCLVPAVLIISSTAFAAVSADEGKQLGTTLTIFGAEKSGNKEGSIPAYTGEAVKTPACYNTKQPGNYCDPWGEKPQFSITAQNAAQYADRLAAGQKEMFKKYPAFRMDIYPSHRSFVYPQYILDNTLKNATACKGGKGELTLEGCYGGVPFPIPKTGNQVMWNHVLKGALYSWEGKIRSIYVDVNGKAINQGEHNLVATMPVWDPKNAGKVLPGRLNYYQIRLDTDGPPRKNGEKIIVTNALDPINVGNRVWQYIPGQRRVKLAPDLAYDTPSPVSGGITVMDEGALFFGAQDRYDFKLVGKVERYIPYNNFDITDDKRCPESTYVRKNFPNPDCVRWELHRTWHVHATLKPGFRHIFPVRDFFFDEDHAAYGVSDSYDAAGKLYRFDIEYGFPYYDIGHGGLTDSYVTMDLQTGAWAANQFAQFPGHGTYPARGATKPDSFFSPESMAGEGIR